MERKHSRKTKYAPAKGLKALRLKAGYSRPAFARRCGIALRSVEDYEYGNMDINGAKLETLCTMAMVLGCTVYDLLTDEATKEMLKQTT